MSVEERLDEIEARANEDADATWEVFQRRFKAFDGYRSPAKQHDLWTVFRSGIQYADQRTDMPALVDALRAVLDECAKAEEIGVQGAYDHGCRDQARWIRKALTAALGASS